MLLFVSGHRSSSQRAEEGKQDGPCEDDEREGAFHNGSWETGQGPETWFGDDPHPVSSQVHPRLLLLGQVFEFMTNSSCLQVRSERGQVVQGGPHGQPPDGLRRGSARWLPLCCGWLRWAVSALFR